MLFCRVHTSKYKVDVDCVAKWTQSWCWLCGKMKTKLMLIVCPNEDKVDVDYVARWWQCRCWLCGQMKTVLMLIVRPDEDSVDFDCVARWRQGWAGSDQPCVCDGTSAAWITVHKYRGELIDHFYIALFCASEQTRCSLVIWNSEWMTVASCHTFWISTKV